MIISAAGKIMVRRSNVTYKFLYYAHTFDWSDSLWNFENVIQYYFYSNQYQPSEKLKRKNTFQDSIPKYINITKIN